MRRSLSLILPALLLVTLLVVLHLRTANPEPVATTQPAPALTAPDAATGSASAVASPGALQVPDDATAGRRVSSHTDRLPLRLSNTDLPYEQLYRQEEALLLANAVFDTRRPLEVPIPDSLRSPAEPAAFVVQARGFVTDAFRARLAAVGAEIVSYVPHNALLVRASSAAIAELRQDPLTQAVLAWEPYFKLSGPLLKEAVGNPDLTGGGVLALTLFADLAAHTLAAAETLGADLLGDDQSPFGPVAIVRAPPGSLTALAALPGVQAIEEALPRVPANDLSRVRLGVAVDTVAETNYLDLTGADVLVAVVDTGVDATHPDLAGRVFGPATNDVVGHGTFVAGIIASSGENGPDGTNASGSISGASFRGIASAARIYSLAPSGSVPAPTDGAFQEAAARTNAFISNNSWSYDASEYTIGAANYDAAVRDALPRVPGSQPALYVFPAGNQGGGNNTGGGGIPGSILSPGTAKNVITVGAIEQLRNVTNEVVIRGVTNAIFEPRTDSENQISAYSSRGNVGIFLEGPYGRFKPDVVAPGNFVVSCRSDQWDEDAYYRPTNRTDTTFSNQIFATNQVRNYSIFIPANAVGMAVTLSSNPDTPSPQPPLAIFLRKDGIPDIPAGDYELVVTNRLESPEDTPLSPVQATWFYTVANPGTGTVSINITTTILSTNDLGNTMEVLEQLNDDLGAPYRYESGTSMAAAHVSGFLALLQEYFEQRLNVTNSPALMKALLINGARSLGQPYSFETRSTVNYQGWGLPNLPTTLPPLIATNGATRGQLMFFDQHPTNSLATGDSHTWTIQMDDFAVGEPLRVTLVWTDPPGNPAASLKLVNDLDLIVTDLDSGDVFVGNDFLADSDFNLPVPTNAVPEFDSVNNVENVYLSPPLGTNYSITVRARRVNVNAVTANTNQTVQDYALVISAGDGVTTNGFTLVTPTAVFATNPVPLVTHVPAESNGVPILRQLAGASAALSSTNLVTNAVPQGALGVGVTNQWAFYVVTNSTTYTNAAFLTFLSTSLALPRMGAQSSVSATGRREADLDLYVSQDFALTNLAPEALAAADKSLSRLGSELIVYSNSAAGMVYYVGVKAESQMAAEFGFVAIFSEEPFGIPGEDGITVQGTPLPASIPDGSPQAPGGVQIFAVNAVPADIRRVVVEIGASHENWGDLLGDLGFGPGSVVLNNHTFGNYETFQLTTYDDSGENDIPDAQVPDGPGSLRSFSGNPAAGAWTFTMVDNSLEHTGVVSTVNLRIEPMPEMGDTWEATIQPQSWYYFPVNVPADATNLTVYVFGNTLPLELYIRRGGYPTRQIFGRFAEILPPGGELSWSIYDNPPLNPGRYFVGIYNDNNVEQTVTLRYVIERDTSTRPPMVRTDREAVPILDDAITTTSLLVTNLDRIVSVEAGLRIEHPRVSDLAITLISPRGTRVLLSENRGYDSTNGFGADLVTTNIVPVDSGGGFEAYTNIVDTGLTEGSFSIGWEFYRIPDQIRIYYEGQIIFDTGLTNGSGFTNLTYGPGSSTLLLITVNEGDNPDPGTLWEYVLTSTRRQAAYAVFTENTNRTTLPIKFAIPPFAPAPTNRVIVAEDFDSLLPGVYETNDLVGFWLVASNSVEVLDDPPIALTPPNYLALGQGVLRATVPTQPGQTYTVSLVTRLGPDVDINGSFEAPPGGSGPAFVFPPGVSVGGWTVAAASIAHLGGAPWVAADGFSFMGLNANEAAPLPGAIYRDVATVAGQSYALRFAYAGDPTAGPVVKNLAAAWNVDALGQFSFDTSGFTPESLGWVYTNFTVVGTGNDRLGFASLLIGTASGPFVDDVALAPLGGAEVYAGGQLLGVAGGDFEWQTNSFSFAALGAVTELEIVGVDAGLLVDVIEFSTLDTEVYYLPEGFLSDFDNESAEGEWTLELWDSRVGATNPLPALLSWELRFVFERTQPATAGLSHGIAVTNVVPPGGILTYEVPVPLWAAFATNTLLFATGPVDLLYNRFQPPTGVLADGSAVLLTNSTGGSAVLSTATTPALNPGGSYYLGVQNLTTSNITFALQVDFDISILENAVPVTDWVLDFLLPRYYRFDVSSDATAVAFALTNLNGNANLYVRRGLPLPTPGAHDYSSAVPGADPEWVLVFPDSTPVPLTPGPWYLGVFNADNRPVRYTIVAVELTNAIPPIITLTNAQAYAVGAPPAGPIIEYYRFNVPIGARRAQFEITQPGGPLSLAVRRGFPPLPDLTQFDYLAEGDGTSSFWLTLFDYSQPVNLSPGPWFLAVVNTNGTAVAYSITATAWDVRATNIVTGIASIDQHSICFAWNTLPGVHYVVQGRPTLDTPGWTDVSPVLQATSPVTTWCLTLPSPYHFFRVAEATGGSGAPAPILPRLSAVLTEPGRITLHWAAPPGQRFRLEWTTDLGAATWNRMPGVLTSADGAFQFTDDGSQTGGPAARRFYRLVPER